MALIAIDGRKYFDYGIGTYVQQLIKSLALLNSQHDFLLYVSPEDFQNITVPKHWCKEVVGYRKYSLGEIAFFGFRANRRGVHVFHEPHYTLPIGVKQRAIVTIHDIIHLRFPQYFSLPERAYSYSMVWHALKHSRFVTTDSEFTKRDILSTFRMREDKISVIPLGVGTQFRTLEDNIQVDLFRKRFAIHGPFILYVGNIKPHKGVATLLAAFKKISHLESVELAILGGSLQQDSALARLVEESEILGRVKSLGRLSDEDLVVAYNAAEVLVLPSHYEGFGLPALEAMACGTPVIVSNAASLPEIVGNAALIFSAGNATELADALRSLLKEPAVRRDLIQKGGKHVRNYTWTRTATEMLALYDAMSGD